jgi:thiamine biosynthesis lipoprotein
VQLALEAMATRFELVIDADAGADARRLRAAGEEALAEIARRERQLSRFIPSSEVSWINAHAAEGPVQVEPSLFRLLERCQALSAATAGAFDVTVGPLVRAWRTAGENGRKPAADALVRARESIGYSRLLLDAGARTVRFARAGMSIDLGAAGKGFALDCAMDVLREAGVGRALLHGGTSSVHTLGSPAAGGAWKVEWKDPAGRARVFGVGDGALSVSAVHGRVVEVDGERYGHVIDPRSGIPVRTAVSAIVTGPGSLECDALSTALLVLGAVWLPELRRLFPGYDGAVG